MVRVKLNTKIDPTISPKIAELKATLKSRRRFDLNSLNTGTPIPQPKAANDDLPTLYSMGNLPWVSL